MKRVLITGKTSYIGTSFASYIKDNPEYQVDTISVRGEDWKTQDFSVYDVVLHVAGIAHKKETKENQQEYFDVNYTLTKELGKKAKDEGVSQFIYLSSMSVYGITEGVITKDTVPNPTSAYGKSKLEAEKYLETLQSDDFKVAIIRPPMVYGNNCPGNFNLLNKMVRYIPIFPKVNNLRSIIYIDNLSFIIKKIVSNNYHGLFLIQNMELVSTNDIIKEMSKFINKRKYYSQLLTKVILLFDFNSNSINNTFRKAYGTLYYIEKDCMQYENIIFQESIQKTIERGSVS